MTEPITGCPVREVLDRIGDKWSVIVIVLLSDGPQRYTELRWGVEGISRRMVRVPLRGRERKGLVARAGYPSVPPGVEYPLTVVGRALRGPLGPLVEWTEGCRAHITASRDRFDTRAV